MGDLEVILGLLWVILVRSWALLVLSWCSVLGPFRKAKTLRAMVPASLLNLCTMVLASLCGCLAVGLFCGRDILEVARFWTRRIDS